jgi:hypothetical protein
MCLNSLPVMETNPRHQRVYPVALAIRLAKQGLGSNIPEDFTEMTIPNRCGLRPTSWGWSGDPPFFTSFVPSVVSSLFFHGLYALSTIRLITTIFDRTAGATGTSRTKKEPGSSFKEPGIYLATTYSHKTYRLTTIGAAAFHFRVRNGTGWFHRALVTRGQHRSTGAGTLMS